MYLYKRTLISSPVQHVGRQGPLMEFILRCGRQQRRKTVRSMICLLRLTTLSTRWARPVDELYMTVHPKLAGMQIPTPTGSRPHWIMLESCGELISIPEQLSTCANSNSGSQLSGNEDNSFLLSFATKRPSIVRNLNYIIWNLMAKFKIKTASHHLTSQS